MYTTRVIQTFACTYTRAPVITTFRLSISRTCLFEDNRYLFSKTLLNDISVPYRVKPVPRTSMHSTHFGKSIKNSHSVEHTRGYNF